MGEREKGQAKASFSEKKRGGPGARFSKVPKPFRAAYSVKLVFFYVAKENKN